MQVHIKGHIHSKILNLYKTIQDSNWRSEGVTYRRGFAPNFSKNNGLNKEIKNPSTQKQKLRFEQWGSDFSRERECVGGSSPGGALQGAQAALGRDQGLTRGWDPLVPLGGPPGEPQALLCLF